MQEDTIKELGNNSKKKPDLIFRGIIIGDAGVGKTTIAKNGLHSGLSKEQTSTISLELLINYYQVGDKLICLQFWDTLGQEKFQSIGTAFYRESSVIILTYSIDK